MMFPLYTITENSIGCPSHSNQRRKSNKRNSNWKRKKQHSLFADVMILYTEYPKDITRNLQELISESDKPTGYKTDTQKSLALLYINNERSEREIKKSIPFTTTPKWI